MEENPDQSSIIVTYKYKKKKIYECSVTKYNVKPTFTEFWQTNTNTEAYVY